MNINIKVIQVGRIGDTGVGRVQVTYPKSSPMQMDQVFVGPQVIEPIPSLELVTDIVMSCVGGYSWSVDLENNIFELVKN